jgi:outer membrane protein assembly factor BamB
LINRRLRYVLPALAVLAAGLLLAGCGGSASAAALTGSSWPGVAVGDEAVYVSAGQQVYAVDPDNATTLWAYPSELKRGQTFYAAPAVADEIIIVTDYLNSVFAVDRTTGSERWAFQGKARFIGSAAVGEDYVYAGSSDGILYALDRMTGAAAWTFAADRDIWSAPLLDAESSTVYVTSLDRHVYALDAETGTLKWQFPANGVDEGDEPMGAIAGTPTLYDGVLYFGSFNNRVYALDTATQQVRWTYETTNWVWSSPVRDEESGLLIGGDLDGHAFALDPDTGEEAWSFSASGPIVSAPAFGEIDGERVAYISSGDGNLYVLSVRDGTQARAPVSIEVEFTSRFLFFNTGTTTRAIPIYAPPVLYEDLILLGAHQGDHPLIAFDRETLTERWAYSIPRS